MLSRIVLSAVALCVLALPALAHPDAGAGPGPLVGGLTHPFGGLDHVIAMVAVGLWAAVLGQRALWMVPAAFVLGVAGGFALATAGIGLPLVEPGIAASVLVLGVMLAAGMRLPLAPSMLLVALFAVLHGHAHDAGIPGDRLTFGLGFAVATMMLHGIGIGLGHVLAGRRLALARGLGGVVAGIGLMLLGGFA